MESPSEWDMFWYIMPMDCAGDCARTLSMVCAEFEAEFEEVLDAAFSFIC